jgi:glyoxylase-like metal-dependent hydrolase (beta-lactamase superfamily II)
LKLTGRVYQIGGGVSGLSAQGDANVYMVDCGAKLAMIDTGGGRGVPRILDNLRQSGFDSRSVEVAFITHCHFDHIGGNHGVKEATGCKIAAHEAEVRDIETLGELSLYPMARAQGLELRPTKVDIVLRDGQHMQVGDVDFEVVHTPGHTPGGICLLIKEGDTAGLFTGDTASTQGRLGYMKGPGCDIPMWKQSVKKLISLKPDLIFPGHGVPALSGAVGDLRLLDRNMAAL